MDAAAGHVLYHAVDLVARATATTTMPTSTTASATSSATSTGSPQPGRPGFYKIVGLMLAVASGLFIGVSFVLKKLGLLRANKQYNEEAGEGYGYLKNWLWWCGMTLMIIGEICNFVAYAFTDAILVTPLGALSVVITTILSTIFLKERLSFVGWVACFLCIVGSVIISLNAPAQSAVADIQEMQHYVISPGFLSYTGVIILGCLFVIFWVGPRYGKKSMLVYLTVCSLIGGLSVVATQGLGSAIVAQIGGKPQFNQWFLYVLFVFVIGTLLTEIVYLNKALNIFNAALVTPTYYVYFTSSTIVASTVLFRGLHGTAIQIIDIILGFLTICSGVVLLQLAKSAKDVPDAKVFSGDLDQIRTVAEVEEPEYEPRADTIRGGAGIVRAMSKVRTRRQHDELKRIHDERMAPISEGEQVEWDGLRRRKTVSSAGGGSIARRKTVHPPLGMAHFPDEISEPDSEVHPGFFGRIGRKPVPHNGGGGGGGGGGSRRSTTTTATTQRGHSPVALEHVVAVTHKAGDAADAHIYQSVPSEHTFGLPAGLQKDGAADYADTAYKSPATATTGPAHIHWAADAAHDDGGAIDDPIRARGDSQASSLAPPRPPPHHSSAAAQSAAGGGSAGAATARRQFSFQNVFHRHRSDSSNTYDEKGRPTSRGALSFTSRHSSAAGGREYPAGPTTTEEERLGLVHGDSAMRMPRFVEEEEPRRDSRERKPATQRRGDAAADDDEDWQVASSPSRLGSSPEQIGGGRDLGQRRTRNTYGGRDDDYDYNEDEDDDDADVVGLYDAPPLRSAISAEDDDAERRAARPPRPPTSRGDVI